MAGRIRLSTELFSLAEQLFTQVAVVFACGGTSVETSCRITGCFNLVRMERVNGAIYHRSLDFVNDSRATSRIKSWVTLETVHWEWKS